MQMQSKRGRPVGSQNKHKAVKRLRKNARQVIASLGPDWRQAELVYDPKLRDSKGHMKRAVRFVLDKKAGYEL